MPSTPIKVQTFLGNLPLFREIAPQELDRIALGTREQHAARGELPTSKGIIASRLNLTLEHFSRVLHELTAANLIAVDGRTVTILDLERLRTHEGA